jgi:ribonuclease HII
MDLEHFYSSDPIIEIGIDEVGRGCLFGKTYIACVILPKANS